MNRLFFSQRSGTREMMNRPTIFSALHLLTQKNFSFLSLFVIWEFALANEDSGWAQLCGQTLGIE